MATQSDVALRATLPQRVLAEEGFPTRKVSIPGLPAGFVLRSRLDELVSTAVRQRLTVVSGPAGTGKTAAVSSWAATHADRRVAWVCLDEQDNDPRRFWRAVVGALHGGGAGPPVGLDRQARYVSQLVPETATASVLASAPRCTLVLDDADVLEEPLPLRLLEQLVRNVAEQVSLVVISRTAPPLRLARLRMQGEVAELGSEHLRFTPDEAAALLRLAVPGALTAGQTSAVVARCDGWAVALRLAARTLEEADDPSAAVATVTSGSHWFEPFVREEILGSLEADEARFLSLASLCDRLGAGLCEATTGATDAERVIERLVGRQLVEPAGGGRYRLPALLAESLRATLEEDDRAAYLAGHRRAARHLERRGEVAAALQHHLAAGDLASAFELAAEETLSGLCAGVVRRGPSLLDVVLGVGGLGHEGDPVWRLARAMGALAAGRPGLAQEHLRLVPLATPAEDWLVPSVAVLRCFAAFDTGDLDVAYQAAALARGSGQPPRAAAGSGQGLEPGWARRLNRIAGTLAVVLECRAHLWLGEDSAAERLSADALGLPVEGPCALVLQGLRATALGRQGRLREAGQLARSTLDAAAMDGQRGGGAMVDAEIALGVVCLERGLAGRAIDHVAAAVGITEQLGDATLGSVAVLELVRPLLLAGQRSEAYELVVRQRAADASEGLHPLARELLDVAELHWRIATRDLQGAAGLLSRLPRRRRAPTLEARLDLLAGRPSRALARLDKAALPADASLSVRTERLLVAARAASQLGLSHRARDAMQRACELGRTEWLVRPFLEGGDEIRWLLDSLRSPYPEPYVDAVKAAMAGEPGAGRTGHPVAFLEGLTAREREALSRLPSHLTQQEIADDLYVSVNTLKTHLKGLYRKLGASSRSEAVAAARLHGLV